MRRPADSGTYSIEHILGSISFGISRHSSSVSVVEVYNSWVLRFHESEVLF